MSNSVISFEQLTGQSEEHISVHPLCQKPMHHGVHSAFGLLHAEAKRAGFDLRLTSAFRSFENQKNIWNNKASGEKIMFDDQGIQLDVKGMSREEIRAAIMRFSAVPGASRHHWGTDMDVYDAAAFPTPDYKVQLTPEEVESGGIFDEFHCWLDERIVDGMSFGFYRPYAEDLDGVARERWHLSYWPLSEHFERLYDLKTFERNLALAPDLALRDLLLERSAEWFERYIANVCPPPWL